MAAHITGAKLQDMFSESQQGATCSFKEPPEHGGKFRWQIIHLKEKNTTDKPTKMTSDDNKSGSKELLVHKDNGELFNNVEYVPYRVLRSSPKGERGTITC